MAREEEETALVVPEESEVGSEGPRSKDSSREIESINPEALFYPAQVRPSSKLRIEHMRRVMAQNIRTLDDALDHISWVERIALTRSLGPKTINAITGVLQLALQALKLKGGTAEKQNLIIRFGTKRADGSATAGEVRVEGARGDDVAKAAETLERIREETEREIEADRKKREAAEKRPKTKDGRRAYPSKAESNLFASPEKRSRKDRAAARTKRRQEAKEARAVLKKEKERVAEEEARRVRTKEEHGVTQRWRRRHEVKAALGCTDYWALAIEGFNVPEKDAKDMTREELEDAFIVIDPDEPDAIETPWEEDESAPK